MPYFHQSYQSTEHHTGVIFSMTVREVQQWCQTLLQFTNPLTSTL